MQKAADAVDHGDKKDPALPPARVSLPSVACGLIQGSMPALPRYLSLIPLNSRILLPATEAI